MFESFLHNFDNQLIITIAVNYCICIVANFGCVAKAKRFRLS